MDSAGGFFFFLFVFAMSGHITGVVGRRKGRPYAFWFVTGFLMPLFGLLLAVLMPTDTKSLEYAAIENGEMQKCPDCAELVKAEATKCRFCSRVLPENSRNAKPWIPIEIKK